MKEKQTSGISIVLAILFIFLLYKACDSCTEPEKELSLYQQDNRVGAYVEAQFYIKKYLTSPGSAKFPLGASREHVTKNGTTYTINSYVDSQNAFGSVLRTNFKCKVIEKSKDVFDVIDFETY